MVLYGRGSYSKIHREGYHGENIGRRLQTSHRYRGTERGGRRFHDAPVICLTLSSTTDGSQPKWFSCKTRSGLTGNHSTLCSASRIAPFSVRQVSPRLCWTSSRRLWYDKPGSRIPGGGSAGFARGGGDAGSSGTYAGTGRARLRRFFLFLRGWLRGLCPWRGRREPQ